MSGRFANGVAATPPSAQTPWSGRAVIHVDMDAFYAAVECLDDPGLSGRPVIVGGRPEGRGVVAAASYAARRCGVRSAMPVAQALRRCPAAVVLPPRPHRYAEMSAAIRAIFECYTPLVEPLALDEAFLDVTGSRALFGPAPALGWRIKREIAAETGLVASVGVAPNKFLAKIASDIDKPDGYRVVTIDEAEAFLAPLPIGRIWGIGPATARVFERHAIGRIGQLRRLSLAAAEQVFGPQGRHWGQLARGIDERPVIADAAAKSISSETTFEVDLADSRVLNDWLAELAAQVSRRLRRAGLRGRTVQIKVRFADFTTLTRSRTLAAPTDITREITGVARQLFATRLPAPRPPVRLLGVGVSGFGGGSEEQADLFTESGRRRERRLDETLDAVRERFGRDALRRGRPPAGRREKGGQ